MLKIGTKHLVNNLRQTRPALASTRKALADKYRASRKTARGAKMLRKKLTTMHLNSHTDKNGNVSGVTRGVK